MKKEKSKIQTVIGIDVGGSTTKIVGFRVHPDGQIRMVPPQIIRAADPITSIYGAFGHFTLENDLTLDDIDKVMITGVGSTFLSQPIYNLNCEHVPEFVSVGEGGLYLSGLGETIVVSMGTGTALIHTRDNGDLPPDIDYMGGTGVGGGTLIGLTRKLTGVDTIEHIENLCAEGDLSRVDLRVKDISSSHGEAGIKEDLTAANFGRVSDIASHADLALGVANMVAESILMLTVFAARSRKVSTVVLTGNLTALSAVRDVFIQNESTFGVRFLIPELAQYGPVIGAALSGVRALRAENKNESQ